MDSWMGAITSKRDGSIGDVLGTGGLVGDRETAIEVQPEAHRTTLRARPAASTWRDWDRSCARRRCGVDDDAHAGESAVGENGTRWRFCQRVSRAQTRAGSADPARGPGNVRRGPGGDPPGWAGRWTGGVPTRLETRHGEAGTCDDRGRAAGGRPGAASTGRSTWTHAGDHRVARNTRSGMERVSSIRRGGFPLARAGTHSDFARGINP